MKQHINEKFNYLTVIGVEHVMKRIKTERRNKYCKITYFICKCICGKQKHILANNVKQGSIKSCGCKKTEITKKKIQKYYTKKYTHPVEGRFFSDYKCHGKEFLLSFKEFIKLVNSNCYYCGAVPSLLRGNKTKSRTKLLNGIDRLDSSIGYVFNNCVPCCTTCNKAKAEMTVEQFRSWIVKIYNNFI